ncbi:hypothetical protein ACFL3I_05915, partial [Pseudomonadota bacterium]
KNNTTTDITKKTRVLLSKDILSVWGLYGGLLKIEASRSGNSHILDYFVQGGGSVLLGFNFVGWGRM